jgi:hypothetical protein
MRHLETFPLVSPTRRASICDVGGGPASPRLREKKQGNPLAGSRCDLEGQGPQACTTKGAHLMTPSTASPSVADPEARFLGALLERIRKGACARPIGPGVARRHILPRDRGTSPFTTAGTLCVARRPALVAACRGGRRAAERRISRACRSADVRNAAPAPTRRNRAYRWSGSSPERQA